MQLVKIGPEAELSTSMERGESREAVVIVEVGSSLFLKRLGSNTVDTSFIMSSDALFYWRTDSMER